LDALRQRLPLTELHYEVIDVVLSPDIVQRADVRMIERRDGPRFTLEADPPPGVLCEIGGEDLDGNRTSKTRVERAINLPHSAGSDRSDDLVRPEACAGPQVHGA